MTDPLREEREIADYWKARAQDAESYRQSMHDWNEEANRWREVAGKLAEVVWLADKDAKDAALAAYDRWREECDRKGLGDR